jgi:hypothetical protein
MHGAMNVKSPNNTSKWQIGFNSAFEGLKKEGKRWRINLMSAGRELLLQTRTETASMHSFGKQTNNDLEFSVILNISDGSVKRIIKEPLSVLERNIRNKRKRAQTSVSFLQNNVRPHVAARTMETIQKLKWNFLPHPPYSPDFAPSDYHFFGPLQEHLGGKRFRINEEEVQNVQETSSRAAPAIFQTLAQVYRKPKRLC